MRVGEEGGGGGGRIARDKIKKPVVNYMYKISFH